MPVHLLVDRWRAWGLWARAAMSWAPPPLKRTADPLQVIASLDDEARQRATTLRERYELGPWAGICSHLEVRESLYVLDVCDRWLADRAPEGPALDVGAKNGAYLPGLLAALPGPWDAVELDAHRRYANLATRRSHAEAILRAYPDSRYIPGSVEDLSGPYSAITWFLPFVVPEPLEAWGLPQRCFEPKALLEHVLGMLSPGGVLLVVNQGTREAEAQQALFDALGAPAEPLGRIESPLSPFRQPRFGFRCRG